MSDIFFGSKILDEFDPDKLDVNTLIHDKVINLKFIREDSKTGEQSVFAIRSDYEVDLNARGEYSFKKCDIKPEIRVEYLKVSENVQVHIKIYVTNLHMISGSADGNAGTSFSSFSAKGNPLKSIVVQMGYFGQFPKFDDPGRGLTLDDFYNLRDNATRKAYEETECLVLAVYPVKLPPDGVTLFDCVVGTSTPPFHSIQGPSEQGSTFDTTKTGEPISVRDYLFEAITRRFPRKNIPSSDLKLNSELGGTYQLSETDVHGNPKTTVLPGPMTKETADNYGVQCYVTSKVEKEGLVQPGDVPGTWVPVLSVSLPEKCDSAPAALHKIFTQSLPNASSLFLPSGNVVIYYVGESADDIKADLRNNYAGKMLDEEFPKSSVLPAIYSITYSGLRSIQCPFFPSVKPFQTISFSSEYNLGTMLSYFYAPEAGQEVFVIINYTVKFSTTEDENVMELFATDSKDQPNG